MPSSYLKGKSPLVWCFLPQPQRHQGTFHILACSCQLLRLFVVADVFAWTSFLGNFCNHFTIPWHHNQHKQFRDRATGCSMSHQTQGCLQPSYSTPTWLLVYRCHPGSQWSPVQSTASLITCFIAVIPKQQGEQSPCFEQGVHIQNGLELEGQAQQWEKVLCPNQCCARVRWHVRTPHLGQMRTRMSPPCWATQLQERGLLPCASRSQPKNPRNASHRNTAKALTWGMMVSGAGESPTVQPFPPHQSPSQKLERVSLVIKNTFYCQHPVQKPVWQTATYSMWRRQQQGDSSAPVPCSGPVSWTSQLLYTALKW